MRFKFHVYFHQGWIRFKQFSNVQNMFEQIFFEVNAEKHIKNNLRNYITVL